MSYKAEKQPHPGVEDARVAPDLQASKSSIKGLYGPPTLVILCWIIFPYSSTVQFRHPQLDFLIYVTTFTFATLAFGFFVLPFVVLWQVVKWWTEPADKKAMVARSLMGWAWAWGILVVGFQLVPWSDAFP